MAKAIKLNDLDLLDEFLKKTGGIRTLREQDSVYTPGKNEYDLLSMTMDKKVSIDFLKKLVESGFNINAGRSPHTHRLAFYPFVSSHDKPEDFPIQGLVPKNHKDKELQEKYEYLKSKGYLDRRFEGKISTILFKDIDGALGNTTENNKEVLRCICDNDVQKLKKLMAEGCSPNFMIDLNDGYFSPLAEACIADEPEIAEVLLFAGGLPMVCGYGSHGSVRTIDSFHHLEEGPNREKWKKLIEQEEMLRQKFPTMFAELPFKKDKVASARKKVLLDVLEASSDGKKEKARDILKKFHEENPEQKTALKFKAPMKVSGR